MTSARPLVLLVQLPIPPPGPLPIRGNVPLAAAYLKVYAEERGLGEFFDIEILEPVLANQLSDRGLVEEILSRRPWLVGFSCYLWNVERSLWIAEQLKRQLPELKVVLGGPEITADNPWVVAHGKGTVPFSSDENWDSSRFIACSSVDHAIIGEGEQRFAQLLEDLYNNSAPSALTSRSIADLNEIPSPWLAGVLDVSAEKLMPLETMRGCAYQCKFCYYPKGNGAQRYFSPERIAAELAHAEDRGVEEVVLLDPTLNGRADFAEFLSLLCRCNANKRLRFSGELRAELLTEDEIKLLAKAGFFEVEIGLQSTDPRVQQLMGRRTDPEAFARGAKVLMASGVKPRVDLILGLPGDTVDSMRRSIDFLAKTRAFSEVQIFNLSILPGTAFRRQAGQLGLVYQDRPPYFVLQTPTLSLVQLAMLMEEAEEALGVEMDPPPPPMLDFSEESRCLGCNPNPVCSTAALGCKNSTGTAALGCGKSADTAEGGRATFWARHLIPLARIDLDHPPCELPPAGRRAQAFTLWLTTKDFRGRCEAALALICQVLEQSPHGTLQIVLDPAGKPENLTAATLSRMLETCYQSVSYLDRCGSVHSGRLRGAKRLIVILPAAEQARMDFRWRREIEEYATIVGIK
jgi:radical SAM superfamily enzyme YgiQ (UPF0313 family)